MYLGFIFKLHHLQDRKELLNTLMTKLTTYCAYCAIQPLPLFPEDEEQDPDLEAEDLLKMLVKRVGVGTRGTGYLGTRDVWDCISVRRMLTSYI